MNDETTRNSDKELLAELTAEVVAAYVGNNPVQITDIPKLIADVHGALGGTVNGGQDVAPEDLKPAVNPKKSVTHDYIICLEDGKQFKSLKRHLMSHYGLTPEEYRRKWGLPSDYPMVAPAYAEARSKLARQMWGDRK